MNKNLSIKIDGKWKTVFKYGENKYGNYQLSINRKALMEILKSDEDWLNLSVFDQEEKKEATPPPADIDDDLPF
jgi:hypothetical protein